MRNIPQQMEKFYEMQHFALAVSQNIIESPEHTIMSSSDTNSQDVQQNNSSSEKQSTLTFSENRTLKGSSVEENEVEHF